MISNRKRSKSKNFRLGIDLEKENICNGIKTQNGKISELIWKVRPFN